MKSIVSAMARWCALLSMCCLLLPSASTFSSTATVTTSGTAVTLSASQASATWVSIQAKPSNTGYIFVGGSNVKASTGVGVRLGAGDVMSLGTLGSNGSSTYDLNAIWIDASVSGEGVSFTYVR